mgnify:CR=1 FL=1
MIYAAAALLLMGCGAEQAVRKGDKFYALGEYYDAAAQYKKAYSQTPAKERALRGQRALKMAECYRRINYTQKAIAAYNNAIRYKQTDSLTHLRLAQQLMKNGNYKEAAKMFQQTIDSMERRAGGDPRLLAGNSMLRLARNGLRSANKAPQWKQEGSYYTVKRENFFNSRRSEYSPMLSGDQDNQLFFSSTRNQSKGDEYSGITGVKNADIFFSQKDDKGKWQKPEAIDSELNSDGDEGACCFSPDGRTMYLTLCTTDPSYPRYAVIATSQRSDAAWSKATELKMTRDTLSAFAHPAVSPDGQWLYFTSDMPGGLGGYDIWRARLTTSGTGAVENLGSPVNTPGNEMFPTFRPNGDLYFSSDGHEGMGGLDIFIAKPVTSAAGSEESERSSYDIQHSDSASAKGRHSPQPPADNYLLEHPGYPLNSQGDDFGMTFEGLQNKGFFSSNRGDGKGWDHIYSFYNPEIVQTVKGWVYEQDGYELPAAQVYLVGNDGTNMKLSVKGDGSFTHEIKPGVDYVLLGTCKGFLNHKEQLRVEPVEESEEYVLQFPLASITTPVLIENIFYDFDKATLRPESATALDSLVTLLNDNPNVTIELSAHADYRGSDAYNKRLTQRRAESVVNYLTEHGIAPDRLTPVGYGEERPKKIRRKLTEKYPFLKTDDVLTEEFIKALKEEEQQEQCNQLNRRTEFRVLRTTYGLFDKKENKKEEPVNP